jgi:putative FmdB family regulatory protein
MPIYEYSCKKCQHKLDALQKIADEPLVECPECGEHELKRLLSAPRFRLKGEGWYETDFKKDNQRNLHSDKDPAKKGDKADSGKSVTADTGKKEVDSSKKGESDKSKSDKKESPKPGSDSKASTA